MPEKLSPRLKAILEALPLAPGMRVLEVGCGTGALARAMGRAMGDGHVLGIDRSARAIALANSGSGPEIAAGLVSFRIVAAEDFTTQPGEPLFDLVVAVRVGALDGRHPEAGARALPRLRAALAPRGRIFIDGVDISGVAP